MIITYVVATATTPNMLVWTLLHKLPRKDSFYICRMVTGGSEKLATDEVHDPELGRVQPFTKARRSLLIWFGPEMTWEAEPCGRR
ncbi:MAG: hypothetical protein ACI8TF_003199 [Paracoccaceae bacterium]|jgi:hypothetical protein